MEQEHWLLVLLIAIILGIGLAAKSQPKPQVPETMQQWYTTEDDSHRINESGRLEEWGEKDFTH